MRQSYNERALLGKYRVRFLQLELRGGAADYSILPESLTAIYGKVAPGSTGMQATFAPVEFQGDPGYATAELLKFAAAAGLPAWNVLHKIGPTSPN